MLMLSAVRAQTIHVGENIEIWSNKDGDIWVLLKKEKIRMILSPNNPTGESKGQRRVGIDAPRSVEIYRSRRENVGNE